MDGVVRGQVVPQIVENLPGFLKKNATLNVDVDLGDTAPCVRSVRAHPRRCKQTNRTDLDLIIGLEADLAESEITIQLGAVRISIQAIKFVGNMHVALFDLLYKPPFMRGINLFFPAPPEVSFQFGKGLKILETVNLYAVVDPAIRNAISDIVVLPTRISVPLDPGTPLTELNSPCPRGLLTMEVLHCDGRVWGFVAFLVVVGRFVLVSGGRKYVASIRITEEVVGSKASASPEPFLSFIISSPSIVGRSSYSF